MYSVYEFSSPQKHTRPVPTIWVNERGSRCFYPDTEDTIKVNAAIRKRREPSSTWPEERGKVLARNLTLEDAMKKSKKSNLKRPSGKADQLETTDAETLGRGQRVGVTPACYRDFDTLFEEDVAGSSKTKKVLNQKTVSKRLRYNDVYNTDTSDEDTPLSKLKSLPIAPEEQMLKETLKKNKKKSHSSISKVIVQDETGKRKTDSVADVDSLGQHVLIDIDEEAASSASSNRRRQELDGNEAMSPSRGKPPYRKNPSPAMIPPRAMTLSESHALGYTQSPAMTFSGSSALRYPPSPAMAFSESPAMRYHPLSPLKYANPSTLKNLSPHKLQYHRNLSSSSSSQNYFNIESGFSPSQPSYSKTQYENSFEQQRSYGNRDDLYRKNVPSEYLHDSFHDDNSRRIADSMKRSQEMRSPDSVTPDRATRNLLKEMQSSDLSMPQISSKRPTSISSVRDLKDESDPRIVVDLGKKDKVIEEQEFRSFMIKSMTKVVAYHEEEREWKKQKNQIKNKQKESQLAHMSCFPLNTLDDLKDFDKKFDEERTFEDLKQALANLLKEEGKGKGDVRGSTRILLRTIFSMDLARKTRFTKRSKNKIALDQYKIPLLIFRTVNVGREPKCLKADVEMAIKDWLRKSNDRKEKKCSKQPDPIEDEDDETELSSLSE